MTKSSRLTLLLISTLFAAAACSSLKVQRNSNSTLDDIQFSEHAQSYRYDSMFYGILSLKKVYESEVCPGSRIETMDFRMDPDDVGLAVLTLGIYFPQHVEILCEQKK